MIRIGLEGNRIDLFLPSPSDMPYKIRKMFFCPTYPRPCPIERRPATGWNWRSWIGLWRDKENPTTKIA
jgi:hypothetical protein